MDSNLLLVFLAGFGGVAISIGLAIFLLRKYGQDETETTTDDKISG